MSDYQTGYRLGHYKRDDAEYDPRWDFADAAKHGDFKEFKRGFEDGFDGKAPKP